MSRQVVCPGCQATLALPDGAPRARCPACRTVVDAADDIPMGVAVTASAPVETPPTPQPKRRLAERPREPERRVVTRPRGNGVVIAIILGGLMFLSLAGVAVGLWFYLSPGTMPSGPVAVLPITNPTDNQALPPPATKPEPPKPPFRMPPLPVAVPIEPTTLMKDTWVKLPEQVNGLAVGGGGRYIVLRFPQLNKLGIFDVNAAKLTGEISIPEGDIPFAASMNKLVVYRPGAKLMQRYDLANQQSEYSKPFDPGGKVSSLCMGSASDGPIYLSSEGTGGRLFDLQTFDEMPLQQEQNRPGFEGILFRASADGRTLTVRDGPATGILTFEGGKISKSRVGHSSAYALAGADGERIFSGGQGVLTTKGTPAPDGIYANVDSHGDAVYSFVPAQEGPFYLHLHFGLFGSQTSLDYEGKPKEGATVYLLGQKKRVASLHNLSPPAHYHSSVSGIGFERCVHMIPRAKLIVVVHSEGNGLTLHPFDPFEALEKNKVDYLIPTSPAVVAVKPDQPFRHQIEARASGNAKVNYELQAGPPGLTVSSDGAVRWDVPANLTDAETSVLVTLRTDQDQEAFHRLTLRVEGASAK